MATMVARSHERELDVADATLVFDLPGGGLGHGAVPARGDLL